MINDNFFFIVNSTFQKTTFSVLKNSSLKRTLTVKRLYVFTAAKAAWNFRYWHKKVEHKAKSN